MIKARSMSVQIYEEEKRVRRKEFPVQDGTAIIKYVSVSGIEPDKTHMRERWSFLMRFNGEKTAREQAFIEIYGCPSIDNVARHFGIY